MEDYTNKIYFARSRKVVLPEKYFAWSTSGNEAAIVSVLRNLETYGYVLSTDAVKALSQLNREQIADFSKGLTAIVREAKGAHVTYEPMYPNFPEQVANASDVELYANAFMHYFGDWIGVRIMPVYEKDEREPLVDFRALEVIDAGSVEDFMLIATNLLGSKLALSDSDKSDLQWFFSNYGTALTDYIPAVIPNKENLASAASFVYKVDSEMFASLLRRASTATDLLRIAAALSGSPASLSSAVRFTNFSKATRRAFLSALNDMNSSVAEDMLRHKALWKTLGEKLHPGEYAVRYPVAYKAFSALRNNDKIVTFNGLVETAIKNRSIDAAIALLSTRPGEFARRLDKLIRTTGNAENICDAFDEIAADVSTPVLWQVKNHFTHRFDGVENPAFVEPEIKEVAPAPAPRSSDTRDLAKELKDFFENRSFDVPETKRKAPVTVESDPNKKLRTFFPKGSVANIHSIEDNLPSFDEGYAHEIVESCNRALKEIYAGKESLGKVFIDPELKRFTIPSAVRSASRSLNTAGRGTRTPIGTSDTVRLFIWWKDGMERTDLDLSVLMLDENHKTVATVSYYNLRESGGAVHSGDITSAPDGDSEFIDISVSGLRKRGIKYVMMVVNSFTEQPFFELPECFAGFMTRTASMSGEIFEPRTVENVFDLTADTKIAVPLIFDLESNESIWTDLALTRNPDSLNNVQFNKSALALLNQSMVELNRPSLYDLFAVHAAARGQQVSSKEDADTSFEVVNGRVSVDTEKIFAEFI